MKILVCISRTPDTTAKISFANNSTTFQGDGVTFIMNPFDEWYALVRAVELAKATAGTVTLITVGGVETEPILRKGFSLEANDGIRIDAQPVTSQFTAFQIAQQATAGNYNIVFTGKETIDHNGSEVGAMIAEYMNLPFISYATKLDLAGNVATINREIEGGYEVIEVQTPFVVSAAKGMAEQKIPTMPNIVKSKSKPIVVVQPQAVADTMHVVKFELPTAKAGIKYVAADNMDELVRLLHEEAKVI